ncbi:uncharacterized protein LOC141671897 [Apium graveolens]|uniref:uncharacterized protein LOC141671897 n=1 Tax=Apium graveolens TaxID=4045 RepID=UPI003D7A86BD
MSRCFPFPPPGYEKKARPDEENLLEKEKRKEKKHKKEKKDKKEKKEKEGKHKKGKESSEEKRRERKEKKERHKHKKDKIKEKEKEKKRPSEDNITAGLPECSTVDNPGSGCTQSDETSDLKFLVGLGKRIRDDDKTTEDLVAKKINLTGQICSGYPDKASVGNNGNSDGNAILTEKRKYDSKNRERSNNSDARGIENGNVQKFVVGQQRMVEGVTGLVGKNVEKRIVHNKIDEHNSSESRGDKRNERDRDGKKKSSTERKSEKEPNMEQLPIAREKNRHAVCNDSITGSSQSNKNSNLSKRKELRINGFLHDDEIRPSKLQRPLSCAKEVVENEKDLKPSKTLTKSVPELAGMVDNHKLESKVPSSHRNTEDRSKFKATLPDIQFASVSHRTGDSNKVNNSVPSSPSTLENGKTLETLKAGSLSSGCRRSDINQKVDDKVGLAHPVLKNVVVHKAATLTAAGEHGVIGHSKVDNKLNNAVPSSRSASENGRTLETLKASSLLASECARSSSMQKVDDKLGLAHPVLENKGVQKAATLTAAGGHEAIGHSKVDNKEHKVNGFVKDKKPHCSSTRPSSTVKQIVGECPKPPHPDSKYLSKILAIPSIEWSDFDGQEWILGSNRKSTEANPNSSQVKETKQVWDKALQLESVDMTALPYVIPY